MGLEEENGSLDGQDEAERFLRRLAGAERPEESFDKTGAQYQELIRRREAGEIDWIDYEVIYISNLMDKGIPITRKDVKNQAIVIRPNEFETLGYIEFVSSSGEVITIDFDDVDNSKPFIIFPADLGNLSIEVPEHEKYEPTSVELATACWEVLSMSDCIELEKMEFAEALGYSFTLLIENGVDDPEQFLRDKRIIE